MDQIPIHTGVEIRFVPQKLARDISRQGGQLSFDSVETFFCFVFVVSITIRFCWGGAQDIYEPKNGLKALKWFKS